MADKQILPQDPFDGQEFVDAFRVKWVYSVEDRSWTNTGVVSDLPIARPEGHELGPTNGLLSARDKVMLDSLHPKAGGFGIILEPGYYLTEEGGADNILTGDVKVLSETLDFECITEADGCGGTPTVKISLGKDFLESYAIEIKGPPGPKGEKGKKGEDGRPGTGDGPKGEPGTDGQDATEAHDFSGIIIEELDEIYDTAVVGLRLDAPRGILEVTRAKMDTPDHDKPATRVAATPIIRGVEFNDDTLDDWQLVAPSGDPAPTADMNLIRLPKGWVGESDSPVPVMTSRLTSLVQSLITHYKQEAAEVVKTWDKELRDWVIDRDKAAREALHELAVKVAECQFELPLEFCLGIEPQDCYPESRLGDVALIVFIDEAESIYYPDGVDNWTSDLVKYRNIINSNQQVFESVRAGVWVPDPEPDYASFDILPEGETMPDEFSRVDISRPPTVDELTTQWNNLIGDNPIDNIFLLVDNSGSMHTSDIQPGYSEFVQWLSTNTNANITEQEFENERWLEFLYEYMESLASTPVE